MEIVKKFSFFYNNKTGSGKCRGQQVSKCIGGNNNPRKNYKDDICIWVKRLPTNNIPDKTYIDVVDGEKLLTWLFKNPTVGVIAHSRLAESYLHKVLINKIFYIPHHHCNFERYKRPDGEIKTVGYIGCKNNAAALPETLKDDLAKIGLDFKCKTDCKTREDVCNFYKTIDIQVSYRNFINVMKFKQHNAHANLKNSLRVANGGSFGIPSVVFPEPSYNIDFDGCFAAAPNTEDIITQCKKLKENNDYYNLLAANAMEKSEQFHIENVAPLYNLLGE